MGELDRGGISAGKRKGFPVSREALVSRADPPVKEDRKKGF
jgi:hypothetical protein